ncbi:hypothetical protein K0M31_013049, partial [Melipona bicolor]
MSQKPKQSILFLSPPSSRLFFGRNSPVSGEESPVWANSTLPTSSSFREAETKQSGNPLPFDKHIDTVTQN